VTAKQRHEESRAFLVAAFILALIAATAALSEHAASAPAQDQRTGRLAIRTTPDAATVVIDGQTRGLTPLTVPELTVGAHELTVRKAGFLENRTTVQVRADATDTVTIVLTALPSAEPTPIVRPPDGGGNPLKWLLLGGAGAAVVGVAAGKAGGGGGGGSGTTTSTVLPGPTTTTISATTSTIGASTFAIRGRVTDGATGSGIAGAQPTIVGGPQAGNKPPADGSGNYVIANLPPGTYNIEFRATDYDLSPQQAITVTNADVIENRGMSLSVPRASFSQSPNPCVANGTATSPGLTCTVDGSSSQNRVDSYEWAYQDGSGTGASHPMQASCRNRSIGANVVSVTLTVRNRSGSNSITQNVGVNKIAGCF